MLLFLAFVDHLFGITFSENNKEITNELSTRYKQVMEELSTSDLEHFYYLNTTIGDSSVVIELAVKNERKEIYVCPYSIYERRANSPGSYN